MALPMPDLPTGIMRGRFSPRDHALYTCGLFAWSGNKTSPGGFFRVRRTQAANPRRWSCRSWRLERTEKYGSPHADQRELNVAGVAGRIDGTVHAR